MESAIQKVATDLDAAASQPGQEQKAVSKVKQKARACLQEMVANVSPAFIRYYIIEISPQLLFSSFYRNIVTQPFGKTLENTFTLLQSELFCCRIVH